VTTHFLHIVSAQEDKEHRTLNSAITNPMRFSYINFVYLFVISLSIYNCHWHQFNKASTPQTQQW